MEHVSEDRISRLPDSLIHRIMSFIENKDAVQTCILSKRWVGVWKSVPLLYLDRDLFPRGREHDQRFIDFVDKVFDSRDDYFDIQNCYIRWIDFEYADDSVTKHVNRWILYAVKHNVQEMTITFCKDHRSTYEIPQDLLNCKSLRKLRLLPLPTTARYVNIILPRSINLPRLEELSLDFLSISDVESLFSSCSVLDTLCTYDCDIQIAGNQRNLIVDSLSLKRFEYVCWTGNFLRRNDNMEANVIKLCSPNLEDFTFKSFFQHDYSIENCSPLSRVNFCMRLKGDETSQTYISELPVYAKRMMKFLGAVYMVKYLSLSPGFLEVLSQALDMSDCQPRRLCNLQSLKLDMWFTGSCLRSIAYLLSISPYITSISLTSKESNLADIGDGWEAGLSLSGMLSHLELVQIKEVEGCNNELKFLSFLLENALVLKKVVLYPRSTIEFPDRVRGQFCDNLRALPRASSRIIMHWPATKSTHII